MKKQIRKSVFETNSSSTHSLIFCNQEEYDALYRHELYIYENELISAKDAIQMFVKAYKQK